MAFLSIYLSIGVHDCSANSAVRFWFAYHVFDCFTYIVAVNVLRFHGF